MAIIGKRIRAAASHPNLIVKFLIRRLRPTSVDETAQNDSLVLLKELLARDYPEIENEYIEDWGKVKLLRQWTHEHVDFGTSAAEFSKEEYRKFFTKDAPGLFATFFQDLGAVMCKGASYTLMKLYQAYEFQSYVLGVGIDGVMTHSVTLVRIKHSGRSILTIQDPTFNVTYVDGNGLPYDYFDFLRTLKNHNLVVVEKGHGAARGFIVCPEDNIKLLYGEEPIAQLPDGRLRFPWKNPLPQWTAFFGPRIAEAVAKDGHPPDVIYLFLYFIYLQDAQLNPVGHLMRQTEALLE